MLRERVRLFRTVMMLADMILVSAAFFVGFYLRDISLLHYPLNTYLWFWAAILIVWMTLLYSFGMYDSFRTRPSTELFWLTLKVSFWGFLILNTFIYIFKVSSVTPGFISFIFSIASGLIIIEKIILINIFQYLRKHGINYRMILVVGTGKRAQRLIELVKTHAEWGLRIVGLIDEDETKIGEMISGYKVIGCFENYEHIIQNNVIDQVVFVVPRSWLNRIEDMIMLSELQGLRVSIAIDFFNFKIARAKQTELHGFPLITFESAPDHLWQLLIKRMVDIFVCGLGLMILAPFFLIIAVLIKSSSRGHVFFKQTRSGLNGRKFTLYKFRTMYSNAEEKLHELLKYNEMQGPVFKMTNDPRLTPIGKFLRKSSLDELPQLWNVFKGEMSLIGPRPPLPAEVVKYEPWQRRRLSMRPGITCIWQVRGRNHITSFEEWMRLDLQYIDNWSLWLDLKIILQTIPVVLFGIGAK